MCGVFSGCGKWGLPSSCSVQASLVVEQGLEGPQASVAVARGVQLPYGMQDLPRPGTEPVSPALAGRILNRWITREACVYFLVVVFCIFWILALIIRICHRQLSSTP